MHLVLDGIFLSVSSHVQEISIPSQATHALLCLTSYSHTFVNVNSFANANVLLVLGELMGGQDDDGHQNRSAIPLTAGAIVTAQLTMAVATYVGDSLTGLGMGRKPLFMAAILSLPLRCALIIWLKDAGQTYLLATQVLDGVGGGLLGLIHPYLVADITFGTGRFNVVSKYHWKEVPFWLVWRLLCSRARNHFHSHQFSISCF